MDRLGSAALFHAEEILHEWQQIAASHKQRLEEDVELVALLGYAERIQPAANASRLRQAQPDWSHPSGVEVMPELFEIRVSPKHVRDACAAAHPDAIQNGSNGILLGDWKDACTEFKGGPPLAAFQGLRLS